MEIGSLGEVGSGLHVAPLCDSSSGSCCDGSSLGAGFNSDGGSRGSGRRVRSMGGRLVARAFPRDVAGLRALVADLAGRAQRTTIGSGAVTGDVTQLSTGIALHSLSLAITGEVVGTTALVAAGSTREATESTAESTGEASTRSTNAATSTRSGDDTLALEDVRPCTLHIKSGKINLRQGDQSGCSCSSGR